MIKNWLTQKYGKGLEQMLTLKRTSSPEPLPPDFDHDSEREQGPAVQPGPAQQDVFNMKNKKERIF